MALTQEMLFKFLAGDLDVEDEVKDDTLLFSTSLIDSFQMMSLIEYIEKNSGIRVPPTDVTLENLDSVSRILAYVARRTA
jgi:D-alanine--poly(phosphoribitol) ligase subunit 2